MIFIDSNIPMYLVGAHHPLKNEARRLVEHCVAAGERLVTDAEVFQEILHRYVAIHRKDAIAPAFEALRAIVDEVYPVDLPTVERAREILLSGTQLSARDALHVAVMEREGVSAILTFDTGFDGTPGITRLRA